MVREEETFFAQGRLLPSFISHDNINLTETTDCTRIDPSVVGEEEATSMGDILCDIFSSQFSHGNPQAATSPQDLFGILDFLETPHEASKFMDLIEESNTSATDGNNFTAVSNLKLPVLEQEPELEPEPSLTTNQTFAASSVHGSEPEAQMPQCNSVSSYSELKDAQQLIPGDVALVRKDSDEYLRSERYGALLKKSSSFQFHRDANAQALDFSESETDTLEPKQKHKRLKAAFTPSEEGPDGQRMTHIAVERNRRKQMNEHLAVLRSLMPGFYVQRGDQASIIGGVIEFIKELQQLLQSLESKKQRKAYTEVLSPRPSSSPRPALSPRPQTLPVSPRTPQPNNFRPNIQSFIPSTNIHNPNFETVKELVANSKSSVADVEVKISGSNALLKTLSHKIPGQILKIVKALENLSLEILHLNISTIDDTVLNSFTLKIGIECKLSVEELAQAVQHTFS